MTTAGQAQRAVQAVLDAAVTTGGEIGLQVAAWHRGERVVDAFAGTMEDSGGTPFDARTLTTVFSVTKGIASTAVHMLVERGQLDLDEPVARYWPAFAANGKDRITVAQALAHLAAIPQMPAGIGPDDLMDWEGVAAAVAAGTPLWQPGTEPGYHSLTHGWITGGLIGAVDGRRIDRFVREEITEPLGIADGFYLGLPASEDGRVAPLVMEETLRSQAPPSPESYGFLAVPPAFYPLGESFDRVAVRRAVVPGAGGIATASALATIYAATIGEVNGIGMLGPDTVRAATALRTDAWDLCLGKAEPKGAGYFLGHGESPMGDRRSAFGHPGYGGAIAFADPDHDFAFALTKNHLRGDLGGMPSVAMAAASAARDAHGIPHR